MTQFRVVGPFEIDGKVTGELVDLDPALINIQVLLDAGHIEAVKSRVKASELKDLG